VTLLPFRVGRRIVRDLGGEVFVIEKRYKPAYHAWGAFTSPLLVALLVMAEQVAEMAGINRTRARRRMLPIVRQTIANYARQGPAGAFSGPIVRGDAATLKKHVRSLRGDPEAKNVYLALARSAIKHLPARNQRLLNRPWAKGEKKPYTPPHNVSQGFSFPEKKLPIPLDDRRRSVGAVDGHRTDARILHEVPGLNEDCSCTYRSQLI